MKGSQLPVSTLLLSHATLAPTAATRLPAAFIAAPNLHATTTSTSLHAKSGFGKSTPKRKTQETFTYPPLEPSVIQTLVPPPADADNTHGDVLSEEIYDRLEAIYGLPQFNFGGENSIFNTIGVTDSSEVKEEIKTGDLFDDLIKAERDDSLDSLFGSTAPRNEAVSSSSYDLNMLPPFTKFRVLHTDPMVLVIDDFLSPEECERYIKLSCESENNSSSKNKQSSKEQSLSPLLIGKSLTVGKDSRSQAQRTSTTWFHYYQGLPELMCRASRLLGLESIDRWEEPQTVRYRRNEKFTWHLDALSPDAATDPAGAGQRVATLLVYLSDLKDDEGGATMFRDLGGGDDPLKVRPKRGSALLFFPSAGGIANAPFDIRTLHCGEAVSENAENEKWIAQLWLCQKKYTPTAPTNNLHMNAVEAMANYCKSNAK